MKKALDRHDILILSALNEEPRLPASELGELVHLSRTAVSRRLLALKESGVFRGRPEIISYNALGYSVHSFMEIFPSSLSAQQVRKSLLDRPEVIRVATIAAKSLVHVELIAVDLAHLDAFVKWAQRLGNTETKIVFCDTRSRLTLKQRLDALAHQEEA